MMLLKIFLICLAITFSYSNPSKNSKETYQEHPHTVILPKDWRPYYYLDKDGKPTGFAIEVFEHIAKHFNLNILIR